MCISGLPAEDPPRLQNHRARREQVVEHLNYPLSRAVAAGVNAQINECWANAWRAVLWLEQRLPLRGYGLGAAPLYAEGWAVDRPTGYVFQHGWVVLQDEVIDPTVALSRQTYAYFPALHFSLCEMDEAGRQAELPVTTRALRLDPGLHRTYSAAEAAADAYAVEHAGHAVRTNFEADHV